MSARSQELAEVGRRLEAARQEAQAREVQAKLTEESAAKTNEVAKAEQQLQQHRNAEAATQNQKTTLTGVPAPTRCPLSRRPRHRGFAASHIAGRPQGR